MSHPDPCYDCDNSHDDDFVDDERDERACCPDCGGEDDDCDTCVWGAGWTYTSPEGITTDYDGSGNILT
jgi:hypothetical protein